MSGSLREKSPGVWEIRVALGRDPLTGRYRSVSRTVHGGKRKAQEEISRIVSSAANGAALDRSSSGLSGIGVALELETLPEPSNGAHHPVAHEQDSQDAPPACGLNMCSRYRLNRE